VGREISANLVPNGGFEETGASGLPQSWQWQMHPGATKAALVSEPGASGRVCLRLDGAPATDAKGRKQFLNFVTKEFSLTPGSHYKLTARVKTTKPDAQASLTVQSYVANVFFWANNRTRSKPVRNGSRSNSLSKRRLPARRAGTNK